MVTPSDDDIPQPSPRTALCAVAVSGAAALGALLYVIAVKLTGYTAVGSALLGITVALGVYPVLSDRASVRGVKLSFWKYASAFVVLAVVVNFLVLQFLSAVP